MKTYPLKKRRNIAIVTSVLVVSIVSSYILVLGPWNHRRKRIDSLVNSGIKRKTAEKFDSEFTEKPLVLPWEEAKTYSSNEVKLSKMWAKNKILTKFLLNYYYTNSQNYKTFVYLIGGINRQVTFWEKAVEWTVNGDANNDGYSNWDSMFGTHADLLETAYPNPVTEYALEAGTEKRIIKKMKIMDSDGKMADWEKWVVDKFNHDEISEKRLNWILENFNDNPATVFALQKEMPPTEIKSIEGLGKDGNLKDWERYIINHLSDLPEEYVDWAENETGLTNQEKYFVSKAGNLPSDFIVHVVKNKVSKYETVAYEEKTQIKFLLNLSEGELKSKSKEWIIDSNLDDDAFTNYFESSISNTDPYTKNELYAMMLYTQESPNLLKLQMKTIENFLKSERTGVDSEDFPNLPHSQIKNNNFYSFYNNKGTYKNFQNTVDKLSKEIDKNDIFLLIMGGHGKKGRFQFTENNEKSYSEIGNILSKINSKINIITIEACYSGSAIETLKDDSSIIITSAAKDEYYEGNNLSHHLFMSMAGRGSTPDRNYLSLFSSYQWAKKAVTEEKERHPQIWNENLANNTYPLEIFIGEEEP